MATLMLFQIIFALSFLANSVAARPTENERVELWHQHHTWPPNWQSESPGYRALMEEREREIMSLTGADERWENWMQFIQSRLVPSFTEKGFQVIQTPKHIHEKLKRVVDEGIKKWDSLPYEPGVANSIYAPEAPKFVSLGRVASEVHQELKDLHEAWIGGEIKLRQTSIYGVRLYQNGSTIVMHDDKIQTHVISSIVHIAHEYDDDNEPWPIQIEDHDGNLHSVSLEEGQMLFYESAKCLHGRMRTLKGKYYGSVFVHYMPVDRSIWDYTIEDVIAAVPPHWNEGILEDHGSRWAGQAITTDSRVVDNAPPRVTGIPPPYSEEDFEEEVYEDFQAQDL